MKKSNVLRANLARGISAAALAAALTVAALLFLVPPLVRRRTAAPDVRVAANAAIYREQLEELTAELQAQKE